MKQHKRVLSLFLAFLMVLTTGIASAFTAFAADGNEAKIGDTEYATLVTAIDAAADGDTITLLRDVTWTAYNKEIKKTITIDGGEQKYKITATQGYTFQFFQSFTLKNLKFDTPLGFRFWNTAGKEAVGTLENVEWTLGSGLLVNLQGNTPGVPLTFNVINSTITKKAVGGDPIIATYSHSNWAKPGICDVTINIDNSTLNQNGGANNGHIGNTAMFYFCCAKSVTLNLKNNTVLNYNPLGKVDVVQAAIVYEVPTTINADATAAVHLIGSGAATAKNYFAYKNNAAGSLTLNDAGAAWTASKAVAGRGFYLPASGSYDVNGTGKAVVDAGVPVFGGTDALTYRKASAEYTESELDEAGRAYSGYSFKVGSGYYRTWADALGADGDIKLLANAPKITAKITLPKDVTIDGQGKYTLSANTYFFALAGHNATFRNLTINTTHGVRTDGIAGPEVLFEDCTVNVTGGLLVNFDRNANVTFRDSTVVSTAGDPVILLQAGAISEVRLVNSTLDYRKGSSGDNSSIINIAGKSKGTVMIDGTSKLIYSPNSTGANNQIVTVHDAETAATVHLKAGAVLEYNTVPASVTSLAFLRNNKSTLNLVDEGATWKVSEAVAKKGYCFVNSFGEGSAFRCKTVAMKTAEGKLYSPTEVINLTAATAFVPVTMGVTNEAGASIRLDLPAGIRFGTQIDKTFYETLGASAVYGVRVARKDVLNGGSFAALTEANSVSYTSAKEGFRWVTEGEFFRTVLMNINEANYQTELSWSAFVTVTYADGKTATYYADYTEADNCRSLAQVASRALQDTTVTWTAEETALLKTIAGIND